MEVYNDKISLQQAVASRRIKGSIGFVPTMGALHQGHLSLIEQSAADNPCTVVSIFVNPTQFNNSQDLEKYPRDLNADIDLIQSTVKSDIVIFAPSVTEMYHNKLTADSFNFDGLDQQMEGAYRPGHFDGVGTIVFKLFELVRPNCAYFGEKDFQQLQIIRKLVSIKNIAIEIKGHPIIREKSGLAKSSRNQLLSEKEREEARIIFEVLNKVKNKFNGINTHELKQFVKDCFDFHPLFQLDYFEICDETSLQPILEYDSTKKYRAFVAIYAGEIRLIDNMQLN